mmetsp:Transcript_15747/g.45001  ORF Transcript_15747/g.45001 Transcript_15747/m.45001 type:complete len:175 (-) Transcript_15747:6-530(-)
MRTILRPVDGIAESRESPLGQLASHPDEDTCDASGSHTGRSNCVGHSVILVPRPRSRTSSVGRLRRSIGSVGDGTTYAPYLHQISSKVSVGVEPHIAIQQTQETSIVSRAVNPNSTGHIAQGDLGPPGENATDLGGDLNELDVELIGNVGSAHRTTVLYAVASARVFFSALKFC